MDALNSAIVLVNHGGRVYGDFAVRMLIQSSVLVVLLLLADRFLRARVCARFRYALWLLVLVKLVLPPSLALPTGINYWLGRYWPAVAAVSPVPITPSAPAPVVVLSPSAYVAPSGGSPGNRAAAVAGSGFAGLGRGGIAPGGAGAAPGRVRPTVVTPELSRIPVIAGAAGRMSCRAGGHRTGDAAPYGRAARPLRVRLCPAGDPAAYHAAAETRAGGPAHDLHARIGPHQTGRSLGEPGADHPSGRVFLASARLGGQRETARPARAGRRRNGRRHAPVAGPVLHRHPDRYRRNGVS